MSLSVITVIEYDAGNVRSVVNMLRALGLQCRIAGSPGEVLAAERVILPGIGHFDFGMRSLGRRGLIEALHRRVVEERIPFLGICLGAQLITCGSAEGNEPGLGWIDAETVVFERRRFGAVPLKVPHMGWADTWALRDSPLNSALGHDARFYYAHSFHIHCNKPEQVICAARHGYEFAAGVQHRNILGVQFHPEKSHRFGMSVLRAFAIWQPDTGQLNSGQPGFDTPTP